MKGVYLGPGGMGVRQVWGCWRQQSLGKPQRGEKHACPWQWGQWLYSSQDLRGGKRLKTLPSKGSLQTRPARASPELAHVFSRTRALPNLCEEPRWGTCAAPTLSGAAVQGGAFQLRGVSGQHWRQGTRRTKG